MTNISATLQISTMEETTSGSEGVKLSVFKLLNGYIITTSIWEPYGGFMYTDYFHEAYDMNSLHFWVENWCENNLKDFFNNDISYEMEHVKGEYPDIYYRQYSKKKRLAISYRKDTSEEIVNYTVRMAEKYLLNKSDQITTAEVV